MFWESVAYYISLPHSHSSLLRDLKVLHPRNLLKELVEACNPQERTLKYVFLGIPINTAKLAYEKHS